MLEALPDGAIVVNTARAEVLDYDALEDLVPKKRLRVGLDVFAIEPEGGSAPFDSRLLARGTVYGTPHIGASTEQAQRAIAQETARIIRAFLTEETVPNVVNICATSPARYAIVVRMLDKVGVLANSLGVLKRHGINIEEVSNTVFEGAQATCTKLRVTGRPSDACLKEIAAFAGGPPRRRGHPPQPRLILDGAASGPLPTHARTRWRGPTLAALARDALALRRVRRSRARTLLGSVIGRRPCRRRPRCRTSPRD